MNLRENWVAPGHKECHGFVGPMAPDSCCQFSFNISSTSKNKVFLTKKNHVVSLQTGQVKTVYPGVLKENITALKVVGTKIKSNAENILQKITTDYNFPP